MACKVKRDNPTIAMSFPASVSIMNGATHISAAPIHEANPIMGGSPVR